ncbi:Ras family GTPase TEM1 KNAG_0E03990 [Huiozyma naganishii CBS 8797]|uniref:Septum-promoting GTP-binding protein 1 n=1 Tax=Huiozyma naganishii (strain ATCC MYA-139 / BCRC 22969 / CBS 8797 / KCTC 17520 / NBRC 10181 / NCYC 3082 / Yp74L-3) TaxID=1071383 RepID=J7RZK5_HUIN7|nr:hypothetical protein KNAG_0E03990 [Kazachstania naganishii CBS 8797]CCK70652.1 hypothetical protein KNAG_0E03990 [Kazachstania naganishii CBS 8797]
MANVRSRHSSIPGIKNQIDVQVGLVGDAQVGKTSLMVKYVQNIFDEEYTQTLGVNFLKRKVNLRSTDIIFSIMDLGGQKEFINMLPLAAVGSSVIIFMFDLTRPKTLQSIKDWFRQAHGLNDSAVPILVGTKYDLSIETDERVPGNISCTAMRYAQVMNAPIVFCSTAKSIHIQKIFKIALAKIFNLTLTVPEIESIGDPLLIYRDFGNNVKRQSKSSPKRTGSMERTPVSSQQ